MADLEILLGGAGETADLPVVFGHEGHALALALHHQGERRRLHAAGGAHVAEAAELGEREVACQNRAPDEVDILAGLAGVGQVLVELHEVVERFGDLALDERRITCSAHGYVGCDLAHAGKGIGTDELALAVEVGGDDDGIGLLCQILENADDLLLSGVLDDGGPGEVRQAFDLPSLDVDAVRQEGTALGVVRRTGETVRNRSGEHLSVPGQRVPALLLIEEDLVGEVGRQDVAGETHGHPLLAVHVETIDRRVVHLVVFRLSGGQELRDLLRCDVFLCNDELQRGSFATRTGMVSSIATRARLANHARFLRGPMRSDPMCEPARTTPHAARRSPTRRPHTRPHAGRPHV